MNKLLLLLCGLCFNLSPVWAQYVPEKKADTTIFVSKPPKTKIASESSGSEGFDKSRIVPGGNFALSFGNPYWIDLSPTVGYLVSDKTLLGVGATYMASGGNYFGYKYSFQYYGGRTFVRRQLMENIYGNAELDFLNVPYFTGKGNESLRRWLVSPLVGASYVVPFGRRGGLQVSLLYNLNYQQAYSPFPSPLIWRVGFFL